MKTLVIIPVCNYYDQINKIVSLYTYAFDEADIIIVDDSDNVVISSIVLNTRRKILITTNTKHGYLSRAFLDGLFVAEIDYNKKYDLVITNEHDVIPNERALYACLEVFKKTLVMPKVASVSTIYKWKHIDCYPTHPHWYNGMIVLSSKLFGDVLHVGSQGVPFGFTLWKPDALRLIDDDSLPPIWKLDSKFGQLLHTKGYHHLRLIDFNVEHFKTGVKSWKKVN